VSAFCLAKPVEEVERIGLELTRNFCPDSFAVCFQIRSSREDAEVKIAAQMPLIQKRKMADIVIDNSGSIEMTEEQVEPPPGVPFDLFFLVPVFLHNILICCVLVR
jgi:Dephospho-CoA kinase